MDAAAEWIAFVGVATTALVGVVGIVFQYLSARGDRHHRERIGEKEREHVERLARAERVFRLRSEAYPEAIRFLELARLHVGRTHPTIVIGEPEEPPEWPGDAEWLLLLSKHTAASSQDVLDAVREAFDRISAFSARAVVLTQIAGQGGQPAQEIDARREMDAERVQAYEAINEAERLMREELAGL